MFNLNITIDRIISKIKLVMYRLVPGFKIGNGTIIRELRYINTVHGEILIGSNCIINAFSIAGPVKIGDNTLINFFCEVSGRGYKIDIGSNVLIAPRVSVMATQHNYTDKSKPIKEQGTKGGDVIIEDDVWIGTNSVILPGVRIGQGAVIGANSVVSHDIEPFSINVGSPTRIIGYRGEDH